MFLSGGQFARERLYCQIENAPPWFARQKGYSVENFTILLKKYADFIVRVGVNPQPGQTLVINCCLEAAPLARLCVRSAYEAGARDVLVNWSDNDVSRSRMELGSEEALSDFKSWQLRRYLDYAESEGGVCVLHILADDPEVYAGLDGAKISHMQPTNRRNIPAKTRYFLISCLCLNLFASLLIVFFVELVKKLFHLADFTVRKGVRLNKVRDIQRGYLDDLTFGILPSNVVYGAENHVEIPKREQDGQHDDGYHSLFRTQPGAGSAQFFFGQVPDFYKHLFHTFKI